MPYLLLVALVLALTGCGTSDAGRGDVTVASGDPSPAAADPAQPAGSSRLRLVRVGTFVSPVYVTAPPGDTTRLFVVEQPGRIRVVRDGRTLSRAFLDITTQVRSGGEQGLLSMAFAPDYARTGRFYVFFTDRSGAERVVEYRRASADRADPASARDVLRQPDAESNHNGGLLLFGPDRYLYVGIGDGGGGGDSHGAHGNGQSLGTLFGKLLRIDPRPSGGRPYGIPRDNPFASRSGARPEIYAYGLRNPWRFAFDASTGDLAIGDVGQDAVEEIDFVRSGRARGANFGWRVYEGTHRYTPRESAPRAVAPVYERSHSDGWCSVTGGVFIHDSELPRLAGRYVFGDYCDGQLYTARLRVPRAENVRRTGLKVNGLSSFGVDGRGRVYVTSLQGAVYRLAGAR